MGMFKHRKHEWEIISTNNSYGIVIPKGTTVLRCALCGDLKTVFMHDHEHRWVIISADNVEDSFDDEDNYTNVVQQCTGCGVLKESTLDGLHAKRLNGKIEEQHGLDD